MDYRDISRIIIKSAGAIIVFFFASHIPQLILALNSTNEQISLVLMLVPYLVPILLGAVMFSFPGKIANKIVDGPEPSSPTSGGRSFEETALRLLSIYFILEALFALCFQLVKYMALRHMHGNVTGVGGSWFSVETAGVVANVIQMAIAMLLLFSTRRLIGHLDRIGQPSTTPPNPNGEP